MRHAGCDRRGNQRPWHQQDNRIASQRGDGRPNGPGFGERLMLAAVRGRRGRLRVGRLSGRGFLAGVLGRRGSPQSRPEGDEDAFHIFLEETGYPFTDETDNAACSAFLATPDSLLKPLKAAVL